MELTQTVFADRSDRGKVAVTGPQRAWFLDQILTQRFEGMEPGEARDSAMLTVHGRMTSYLEALATEDRILCHLERGCAPDLVEALTRYLFATRAEINDVTEDFGLVLVAGPDWANAADAPSATAHRHPTRALGIPAAYLWMSPDDVPSALDALGSKGAVPADEDQLEGIRIANGVPRWGHEMNAKTLPQEVGIDAHAVHYEKGCYLGQEAMAKIHFRGKVNRRLARLAHDGSLAAGQELRSGDKKVGAVTSVSDGRALAVIRYDVPEDTELTAGEATARVVS